MHRRKRMLPFAALLTTAAAMGCAQAGPSEVAFVREIYQDEIREFSKPNPGIAADFTSLLSRPLQDLLSAAKAGPGPKFDGPILHTFFGWHVTPVSRITLRSVAPSRTLLDRGKVSVTLDVDGRPREITVTVSEDCWAGSATVQYCIGDLRYENGVSYRDHLKSLAAPGVAGQRKAP